MPRGSTTSRATLAHFRGPAGSTSCPWRLTLRSEGPRGRPALKGNSGLGPRAAGTSNSPGRVALRSDGLRCRPDLRSDSRPCPWFRGVHQLTRGTFALVRGLAGSTHCPARIGSLSEGLRCRPTVPGDSGPGLRALGSTSISQFLRPIPEGPRFQPASQATLDRARGAAVSNSIPRRLALGLRANGVD